MPTRDEILEGLTRIAGEALALAVAWHAVIAVGVIALVLGWRPSRRLAGLLLSLPAVSVAILAFVYDNPFNGGVFAAISLALATVALRLGGEPAQPARSWALALGTGMLLFGWVYPHFLADRSVFVYVIGAPTGLVPCPTLSLMIGFTLIADGLSSRSWSLLLGTVGSFYGGFGAARLGVTMDLALFAGAIGVILLVMHRKPRGFRPAASR